MKNNLIFPLVVLIVGTIVSGLVYFYITKAAPDVRFTLSDSIPISFLNPNGNPEIIQQLEVKNIGNESAKNIQIKINGEIIASKLDKNSNADDVKVFEQNKNFELVYPELPPQGGFKLTLKSQGSDINKSNLSVLYNLGLAQEAFTKNQSSGYLSLLLPFLIQITLSIPYLFGMSTYYKQSGLKHEKSNTILEMNKPWYIREAKWKTIVEETLHYRIARDYIADYSLNSLDSYNLLSTEKPAFIDENKWKELIEKAAEKLKELYQYKITVLPESRFHTFLSQQKPKYLKDAEWDDLLNKANEKFIPGIKYGLFNSQIVLVRLKQQKPAFIKDEFWGNYINELQEKYYTLKKSELNSSEELIVELKKPKPDEVSDEIWIKLRKSLERNLITQLEYNIALSPNPIKYLQEIDLSFLPETNQKHLWSLGYMQQLNMHNPVITLEEAKKFLSLPKPEWMKDVDFTSLERRAKKIIEIEENETDFNKIKKVEEEKNEEIRKDYQSKLNDFSEKTNYLNQKLKEIGEFKTRIENQLSIINLVINEPEKIERIEDYSHSFASGNFEDLKKLAELNKNHSNN